MPADQPAAAHRHEHRRHPVLRVAQNLVADRALAGDDERIVEGMNEGHAVLPPTRVSQCACASA